jgi:hypothetical protein
MKIDFYVESTIFLYKINTSTRKLHLHELDI